MKWISCTVASFLPLSAALSSSAALYLEEATAAVNIPKVPKVENSDADGFPVLPTVGSLLTDVSQSMHGLNLQTKHFQEELQELERTSETKLKKQKIAYDQLLRKQEGANQKLQAKNGERAKAMMGLRDTARKTQAEIKKVEKINSNQRAKLTSLQDQLKQVQQATEDALGDTDDAKAPSRAEPDASVADDGTRVPQRGLSFLQVKPKALSEPAGELKVYKPALSTSTDEDDDYGSVGDEANAKKADAKVLTTAQKSALRSLAAAVRKPDAEGQLVNMPAIKPADRIHQSAVSAKVAPVEGSSSWLERSLVADEGRELLTKMQQTVQACMKSCEAHELCGSFTFQETAGLCHLKEKCVDEDAASSDMKAAKDYKTYYRPCKKLVQHDVVLDEGNTLKTLKASEHVAVDDQSEALAPAAQSQGALAVVASDSTQVLEEGVTVDGQTAAGMVASLSSVLKMHQMQVHQSEAKLKLHFQKAYRAGKTRHDALIKQSEALEMSMRSMQAQEQKLEASLTKLHATEQKLKQKIHRIAGFLGKAIAPIGNAKQSA